MAQELIIASNGSLQRFTQFPVRIGRALDNDFILTGAGSADYHAQIEMGEEGLQLKASQRCYLNGQEILTPEKLPNNARLQIGLETFLLNPQMPTTRERKGFFWQCFSTPFAVLSWFLLAIALPTWEGYLNSPQTYIPNYETPLIVTFWILALSFILHSMVFTIAKRYLILPILGIVSAFISVGTLTDWTADWYGFQFNGGFGEIASAVGTFLFFVILFRAFLRDFVPLCGRALWKVLLITVVPILLFSVYSYLKQNDFFKKRPGSYPVYQTTLQKDVLLPSKIKSINDFFMIDKSDYKE